MKTGILLLNLGTPDAPSTKAVRRYLREFLLDPRVIDLPGLLRRILVYGFILPFRPKYSAEAYQSIWTEDGSPLLQHSIDLSVKLQQELPEQTTVALGMRYGNPSIASAIEKLAHCQRVIVIPLFPQYSSAATGSAMEKAMDVISKKWNIPDIKIISDFYEHPGFINAQAEVIKESLVDQSAPDFYLFSYHGVPERHIAKSENRNKPFCTHDVTCPVITDNNRFCYRAQCYATSRALTKALDLPANKYMTTFQSRLGRTPWIKPYTDEKIKELAKQGVKHLAVACPSFTADCLETIEEIGMRGREDWIAAGGEQFTLLPCVNAHTAWVNGLIQIIKEQS